MNEVLEHGPTQHTSTFVATGPGHIEDFNLVEALHQIGGKNVGEPRRNATTHHERHVRLHSVTVHGHDGLECLIIVRKVDVGDLAFEAGFSHRTGGSGVGSRAMQHELVPFDELAKRGRLEQVSPGLGH